MRHVLRVLRNSAFALLACSAPAMCPAAELGVEMFDGLDWTAIVSVKPGSLADANGLRRNDRIVQIDGKRILSARDLQEALQRISKRKRDVRIAFMRHGGFRTMRLEKRPFRARPFVADKDARGQSTEQCLRSPTIDCLRNHILAILKGGPDTNARDAAGVAREFVRIGRPDLAGEFLDLATEIFLERERVLDGSDFRGLAQAYRSAGVPLPPKVLEKAEKLSRHILGPKDAVYGLHIAGNTELAERLLQEALAARQTADIHARELSSYWYEGIATGYARLGKMQAADAVKLDARFSPEERFELDLAIAETLVDQQRYEDIPKALDIPLADYRTASAHINADLFSRAAWLYWRSGHIAATEQIAEFLVARTKAGGSAVSQRGELDAAVEVLGLLGRVPEAITLIETSMTGAGSARRAEVDYRLISGAMRRSGQNKLDSRLQPVADRALAHWRNAYAETTQWPQEYEKSISHLYRLQTRNGSAPPPTAEMEWQASPSIDAAARKSLLSAIASDVLTGLNEARRTKAGPAWALSAHDSLIADRRGRGPITSMVMLLAAERDVDQAIRFGEEMFGDDPLVAVARDLARSINVPSLAAARDFDSLARIYATLTRPIQKMNLLVSLLIPVAGRCDTCTL